MLARGAHAGRAIRARVMQCRDVARRSCLSPTRGDTTLLLVHSGCCSCIPGAACARHAPVVHLMLLCVALVLRLTRRLCMPPVSPAANACHLLLAHLSQLCRAVSPAPRLHPEPGYFW